MTEYKQTVLLRVSGSLSICTHPECLKSLFFQHFSFCFLLSVLRHVCHPSTRSGPDPCWVEWGELPSCGDLRRFFETTILSWDAHVVRKQPESKLEMNMKTDTTTLNHLHYFYLTSLTSFYLCDHELLIM